MIEYNPDVVKLIKISVVDMSNIHYNYYLAYNLVYTVYCLQLNGFL